MFFDCGIVCDPRIVHIESYAVLCGYVAPDAKLIADESRCGAANFGRIATEAPVALTVDLNIVRIDLFDDPSDHSGRYSFAHFAAVGPHVIVEVYSEKALVPTESFQRSFAGFAHERCPCANELVDKEKLASSQTGLHA